VKEVIGDALRNAAMRFGCALDLWHKGDLHIEEDTPPPPKKPEPKIVETADKILKEMANIKTLQEMNWYWDNNKARINNLPTTERQAVIKVINSIKSKSTETGG